MTPHPPSERLDEFVDGLLPEVESRAVERHLEGCPECRREVLELRNLLAEATALPRERAPERDLWPGIRARLAPRPARRFGFVLPGLGRVFRPGPDGSEAGAPPRPVPGGWGLRWPRPALAAVALLFFVGGVAVTTLVVHRFRHAEEMAGPARVIEDDNAGLVRFRSAEATYETAARQLAAALAARRGSLEPETARVIDENLRLIDEALLKSREALNADPGDPRLSEMVAATYQTKINLLRKAVSLPS